MAGFIRPGSELIFITFEVAKQIVMTAKFLQKPFLRAVIFALAAIPLRMQLDLAFAAVYRYYSVIRPVREYIGAVILTVTVLEIVLFIKRMLNKKLLWTANPIRRLVIECLITVPASMGAIVLLRIIINIFLLRTSFINFYEELLTTIYYFTFLAILPAILEFLAFLLNRWRTNLAELERYKKENAEFQFETLRTQVNPHFLFNSLNTLSSLVYEDREKASLFIRHLSDVYRYVLENRNRETITLEEELRFIRSFIYLYQLRFDKKLILSLNPDETMLNRLVAPMTLQMLIENAVKHNVISAKRPLHIDIFTSGDAYLNVRNNLQKKLHGENSTALGLKNIVSRYGFLTQRPVEIIASTDEFLVKVPLI